MVGTESRDSAWRRQECGGIWQVLNRGVVSPRRSRKHRGPVLLVVSPGGGERTEEAAPGFVNVYDLRAWEEGPMGWLERLDQAWKVGQHWDSSWLWYTAGPELLLLSGRHHKDAEVDLRSGSACCCVVVSVPLPLVFLILNPGNSQGCAAFFNDWSEGNEIFPIRLLSKIMIK